MKFALRLLTAMACAVPLMGVTAERQQAQAPDMERLPRSIPDPAPDAAQNSVPFTQPGQMRPLPGERNGSNGNTNEYGNDAPQSGATGESGTEGATEGRAEGRSDESMEDGTENNAEDDSGADPQSGMIEPLPALPDYSGDSGIVTEPPAVGTGPDLTEQPPPTGTEDDMVTEPPTDMIPPAGDTPPVRGGSTGTGAPDPGERLSTTPRRY